MQTKNPSKEAKLLYNWFRRKGETQSLRRIDYYLNKARVKGWNGAVEAAKRVVNEHYK